MTPNLDSIASFPLWTYEKLRYADTDRQGHVNNAIFSTMLETGRVELLYAADRPMCAPDCTFVIASLQLDFRGEITWPGTIEIGTRVLTVGRSSLTLEQALFQENTCRAMARTVIVQMDSSTRRSSPLTPDASSRLEMLMHAVEGAGR